MKNITATRRNKNKTKTLVNNNKLPIGFLFGILIGIITTVLIIFMLNNTKLSVKKTLKKTHTTNKELNNSSLHKKTSYVTNTAPNSQNNNYEFYNLLPNMSSQMPSPQTSTAQTQSKTYFIQTGSFYKITEADELKAKLTLLGFEAKIETISVNGSKQYKILLGPFPSEQIAIAKKEQLVEAGFKAVFIKNVPTSE